MVKAKDYSQMDAEILQAIQAYDGIPNPANLSKDGGGPLDFFEKAISERLKQNPLLAEALESRGIEYVTTCDRSSFDNGISSKRWNVVSDNTRKAIIQRLDGYILDAIQHFNGIPNACNLLIRFGSLLEYSNSTILRRLKENPALAEALEARGIEYVNTCDRSTFDKLVSSNQWSKVPKKIRAAITRRLDGYILDAIQHYVGIPNAHNLSNGGGGPLDYGKSLIRSRLKENPALAEALEARGIEYVNTCDRSTFDKLVSSSQWSKAPEKIRAAINQRLDGYILDAIQHFNDIPTPRNVCTMYGGPLNYSNEVIRGRVNENPILAEALEARSIEFVSTCNRAIFDDALTSCRWINANGKTRNALDSRLDGYILEAIQHYTGIPNIKNLSSRGGGPLVYGHHIIGDRLKKNPVLRAAFYLKRGLSEDQINAIEVERDDQTPAMEQSILKRLPNMRIFREAMGLLKQLPDLFKEKKTLEVSFYPGPLSRASEMLGITAHVEQQKAHALKDASAGLSAESRYDTAAFLQFCHRISNEALINALNQANCALAEEGVMLVSVPEEFSRTPRFEMQVQDFGFELQAEGTLFIKALSLDELASLGVADPVRVRQKIDQATNIMILKKMRPGKGSVVDSFINTAKSEGNGEFHPSLGEIDVPPSVLENLASAFQKKNPSIGSGFILTVLDDKYSEKDLIGFDMDVSNPRSTEIVSADAPALRLEELSTIARRLAKTEFRAHALVRPGHETKIPAKMLRSALSA